MQDQRGGARVRAEKAGPKTQPKKGELFRTSSKIPNSWRRFRDENGKGHAPKGTEAGTSYQRQIRKIRMDGKTDLNKKSDRAKKAGLLTSEDRGNNVGKKRKRMKCPRGRERYSYQGVATSSTQGHCQRVKMTVRRLVLLCKWRWDRGPLSTKRRFVKRESWLGRCDLTARRPV